MHRRHIDKRCLAILLQFGLAGLLQAATLPPDSAAHADTLRLIAVGDINMGRKLGRILLHGDTLYPFVYVADTFKNYDLVFANLESTISDQHGETERENMVFTAPPIAAHSLKLGNVNLVSVANNHAFDYGCDAIRQTLESLDETGILCAGTRADTVQKIRIASIEKKGIRVALLACSEFMNNNPQHWRKYVACCDTAALSAQIRAMRASVDLIIVSYHGGDEYKSEPAARSLAFARAMIRSGAGLVLGHHPHVAYGIEYYQDGVIAASLGNFIFVQPQYEWTQYSYAFTAKVIKDSVSTRICNVRLLPIRCGFRPKFLGKTQRAQEILDRAEGMGKIKDKR
jgi:poly-gamma-glutamate synthesis protein (capsule biosynthesis protein)